MKNFILLLFFIIAVNAFGATAPYKITNDKVKMGNGTTNSKGFEFDMGLGVLNPTLNLDNVTGFSLSKDLSIVGGLSASGVLSSTATGTHTLNGPLTTKAITSQGNTFTLGDGAASAKKIELNKGAGANNPYIAWDEAQSALTFSNDGTLVKKLGSGSGSGGDGGVNLLTNASFEDGAAFGWTNSGGTFTVATYATGTEDNLKYAEFVATSASQTLCSNLAPTPTYFGAGGMVDFSYTGTGSAFIAYVLDGSSNKLTANQALLNQTTWTKLSPIPFSLNSSQKLCFESTGAGTIKIDKTYLGSNKNVTSISQASLVGSAYWSYSAGCSWSMNPTVNTWTSFSAVAACTDPTFSGDVGFISGADTPSFTLNAKKGTYKIKVYGTFRVLNNNSGGSDQGAFRIYDGTNAAWLGSGGMYGTGSNSVNINGGMEATYVVDTAGVKQIQIQGLRTSTQQTVQIEMANGGSAAIPLSVEVWYFPNTADQVQTPEASQWFIDANIGGANIGLASGVVSSYTEITSSSLDLVLNTYKGTANAKISCTSGVTPTGLTCTGNEAVGIVFTPPYSGLFEACFDFSTYKANNTSVGADYFQIVEVQANTANILQEGGSRIGSAEYTDGGTPFSVCGTFKFSDTSEKTIKLMYEQNASISTSQVKADRDSNSGQRDIHITVRPLLQNSLRAILTGDQVTTPGVSKPKIVSGTVGSGGAVVNEIGDSINGNCSLSSPNMTCTFNSGFWTQAPNCTVTVDNSSTALAKFNGKPTVSTMVVNLINSSTGGAAPNDFEFICHGY